MFMVNEFCFMYKLDVLQIHKLQ